MLLCAVITRSTGYNNILYTMSHQAAYERFLDATGAYDHRHLPHVGQAFRGFQKQFTRDGYLVVFPRIKAFIQKLSIARIARLESTGRTSRRTSSASNSQICINSQSAVNQRDAS